MKIDCFGVKHSPTCREPKWGAIKGGQVCHNCKTKWKIGNPSTPPRRKIWQ